MITIRTETEKDDKYIFKQNRLEKASEIDVQKPYKTEQLNKDD